MNFSYLSVALKNLKRNPFRTGVLILSIATLVSLLIFAAFFTTRVRSTVQKASDRLGADLLIVPVGARGFAEEFLLESKNKSFYMNRDLIDRVRQIDGIEAITEQTYLETISGICCDIARTQVVAFNQETDFIVRPWLQRSLGRPLKSGEAIAGFETNKNLGLQLLEVEKTLFNKKFRIVGVLDKTGTGLDNALFMTEEDLDQIIAGGNSPLKKGQISIIFAKIRKGLDPYHVGLDVEGKIIDVDVVARREMGGELLTKLGDINKIFLISSLMATVLTVLLVWAIFTAIANERTREIGIMRALGAKQSHIVRLFVLEVLTLGLLGSLIGMLLGTCIFVALTQSFAILKDLAGPTLSFETRLILQLKETAVIIGSMVVGTGICLAGALEPIHRLRKTEPLIAIKE